SLSAALRQSCRTERRDGVQTCEAFRIFSFERIEGARHLRSRLPDLAAFGLTYPPGAQCYWSVVPGSQLRAVPSYLAEASRPALPSSRTAEFSDVRWFYPP